MEQDPNIGRSAGKSSPDEPPIGTAAWIEWQRAARLARLRDHQDGERAAARARHPDASVASLAAAQAAAADRSGTNAPPSPVADRRRVAFALPPAARMAAGLAVENPKIWEADVRPIRAGVSPRRWLRLVHARARARVLGDVQAPTIERVAGLLAWFGRHNLGYSRATFDQLAELAGVCRETSRRVIRGLEAWGLLDTFNVLRRRDGQVERAANLYILRDTVSDDPPPSPWSEHDRAPESRLERYSEAFGLRRRAWGLNATPRAFRRFDREELPAPS